MWWNYKRCSNVSTNVTNAIPTNVKSAMSTNSDDKKVGYKMVCYILYTILLVIILLFIIALNCYHCTKDKSKQKLINAWTI